MIDSSQWTGRTGAWKHIAGFLVAWVERDHWAGMMLPVYGIEWGHEFDRMSTSFRLYWGFRRWRWFDKPMEMK